jgi:hypothetical protein
LLPLFFLLIMFSVILLSGFKFAPISIPSSNFQFSFLIHFHFSLFFTLILLTIIFCFCFCRSVIRPRNIKLVVVLVHTNANGLFNLLNLTFFSQFFNFSWGSTRNSTLRLISLVSAVRTRPCIYNVMSLSTELRSIIIFLIY